MSTSIVVQQGSGAGATVTYMLRSIVVQEGLGRVNGIVTIMSASSVLQERRKSGGDSISHVDEHLCSGEGPGVKCVGDSNFGAGRSSTALSTMK